MEYRKVFLDTCILSEIGRMKKEDRGSLAYKFLVTDKLKIILTPFNLIEIEDMPDETVKKNIYDFLDLSFVGFAKNSDLIFREEIEKYFSNDSVEAIEFNLSYLQKDRDGKPFNFKTFKNALFENSESYIAPYVDIIVTEAKQVERYREIKEKGLINSLNNKIIKKYNEVIKKVGERILFNL